MMWHLPLAALQAPYENASDASYEVVVITHKAFIWQGSQFRMKLNLTLGDGYVHAMAVEPVETTSRYPFDGFVAVYKAPRRAHKQPEVYVDQRIAAVDPWRSSNVYLMVDTVWHEDEVVQEHVKMDHTAGNWMELEAKLRALRFVHSDGCLHIETRIDKLC